MAEPETREHSISLMLAFLPIRRILIMIGQMPFVERKKKDNTITYKFNIKSSATVFFATVYILATINFLLLTWGMFDFFIDSPNSKDPPFKTVLEPQFKSVNDTGGQSIEIARYNNESVINWELYTVQQQFIPIIVVWSWMFLAIIGSTYTITHGHAYSHYFNYWHRVVQAMDMDVTRGIRQYLYIENLIFFGILLGILALYVLSGLLNIHVVGDVARVMANFVLRNFGTKIAEYIPKNEKESWEPEWHWAGAYGTFIIMFAYAGSRTNIVQFVFFCRTLTNTCTIYNDRLLAVLTNKQDADSNSTLTTQDKRKIHKNLFREHLIIVQLFRMTESLFAPILLTYYLFQVTIITLQLYNIFSLRKTSKYEAEAFKHEQLTQNSSMLPSVPNEEKYIEERRAAIGSCILSIAFIMQGWIFVSITTSTAAKAAEHANAAFKIVRRNGYITCETKKERNLMHSLIFSFARTNPIRLTAGGYFAINMALLPALIGTVLNYIVAVYTLKPDVWEEDPPELLNSSTLVG